ncbi:MAG: type II secretion system F family protein [Acidobacteria bacterium]|nr:type II secretion system F family protein [Acidobacteriota bacterium]
MAEFLLKYADARGQIHQQVEEGSNEQELRERFTQQGFLIYSIKRRAGVAALAGRRRAKKVDLEKFLIFNQQFVTLVRAGLPILKCLDLLCERLTDAKLSPFIREVRDDVKNGTLLSEAFARRGIFPAIFITSILAGEKSGALGEVLERYVNYQRLALEVRKKLMLSLLYPALLVTLVIVLIVFLVTYVVPNFAQLYQGLQATLPAPTRLLIAIGTTARDYILAGVAALIGAGIFFRAWAQRPAARTKIDMLKLKTPVAGEVWAKFQVAQLARVLSTTLTGGIPLVQALETASESVGSALIRESVGQARKLVKEGQSLSGSLATTGVFPPLAIDMIEVGESTGALPQMLASVAEFYEDDVKTRMTAALALIEPMLMIFMGGFVAFVLIGLYLPIFSLADTLK